MEQMTFSGSCPHRCINFRSNPFAKTGAIARVCNDCGCDIQDHSKEAVTEKEVLKALESVERVPSLIVGTQQNGLYQGGWQAAMNEKHLVESKTGLVINTAGGLVNHFPKFRPAPLYERLGIKDLRFDWEDSSSTTFTVADMAKAQEAIQSTLENGQSVLVHCAQGRSRSGSVVVYYVSRSEKQDIYAALKSVQAKRAMSQPNDHFMKLLLEMTEDGAVARAGMKQHTDNDGKDDVVVVSNEGAAEQTNATTIEDEKCSKTQDDANHSCLKA